MSSGDASGGGGGEGRHTDLLVFGYGCKVFRDDERAAHIEAGQHLIPWMGRQELLIDRYDGRGHLFSLSEHEASAATGEESSVWMSAAERAEEEACQEERYRAMHEDEMEAATREEEERKRAQAAAGQQNFAYNYDAPQPQLAEQQRLSRSEQPSLKVLASCIEKTAEFIARQGAQMEILMRAKEADNAKFQFLNPDNPYHGIYRQVLEKKRGRPRGFDPAALAAAAREQAQLASLEAVEAKLREVMANMPSAAPTLAGSSTISTSGSTNAYSKLVERIRVNQAQAAAAAGVETPPQVATPPQAASPKPPPLPPPKEEDTLEEGEVLVTPPPITMQPLIDKTASYVARSRAHAEKLAVVRKRDPDGFAFLSADNKYHQFYQYKVALYREMLAERGKEEQAKAGANNGSSSAAREPTHEEQMQQVASKFPTLKGFFR